VVRLTMWRSSGEGEAGPAGPPMCGGSLGPVHGEVGVMRWLGDGEQRQKQRMAGDSR
jgi:hypothetical protein